MKVILNVDRICLLAACAVAERVTDPEYQWPSDGLAVFGNSHTVFAARRNKASVTIWQSR